MSAQLTVRIRCDVLGCQTEFGTYAASIATARTLAFAGGWRYIRGQDFCPEHRTGVC